MLTSVYPMLEICSASAIAPAPLEASPCSITAPFLISSNLIKGEALKEPSVLSCTTLNTSPAVKAVVFANKPVSSSIANSLVSAAAAVKSATVLSAP